MVKTIRPYDHVNLLYAQIDMLESRLQGEDEGKPAGLIKIG